MKRILLFILLIVVLGVVTTVTVAWALAVAVEIGNHADLVGFENGWAIKVVRQPGVLALIGESPIDESPPWEDEITDSELPGWSRLNNPPSDIPHQAVSEMAFGWPFPALYCRWSVDGQARVQSDYALTGGIGCRPIRISRQGISAPSTYDDAISNITALPVTPA